jgi:hypothetical protein
VLQKVLGLDLEDANIPQHGIHLKMFDVCKGDSILGNLLYQRLFIIHHHSLSFFLINQSMTRPLIFAEMQLARFVLEMGARSEDQVFCRFGATFTG